jgi:GAF domain-containing protein
VRCGSRAGQGTLGHARSQCKIASRALVDMQASMQLAVELLGELLCLDHSVVTGLAAQGVSAAVAFASQKPSSRVSRAAQNVPPRKLNRRSWCF